MHSHIGRAYEFIEHMHRGVIIHFISQTTRSSRTRRYVSENLYLYGMGFACVGHLMAQENCINATKLGCFRAH